MVSDHMKVSQGVHTVQEFLEQSNIAENPVISKILFSNIREQTDKSGVNLVKNEVPEQLEQIAVTSF